MFTKYQQHSDQIKVFFLKKLITVGLNIEHSNTWFFERT